MKKIMLALFAMIVMTCMAVSVFAAFSSTVTDRTVFGNKRVVLGTYTSADGLGTTGGDIETGLAYIDQVILQPKGSSVATNASVVNESLPMVAADLTGGVTIVTDATQSGTFMAIGR